MTKIKASSDKEFPNPVLMEGRDDYINCEFQTENVGDISIEQQVISFKMKYSLKCDGLRKLIKNEEAIVALAIKCSATSFSRLDVFPKDSEEMKISIPEFDVAEKVEVTGYIIANKDIEKFTCPDEFNNTYFEGDTFEIRKGDILATEDPNSFYLDEEELKKPIASIFEIIEKDDLTGNISPAFNDHKINIYLKKDSFNLYSYFVKDSNLRDYANGVIVYSVLVEALALFDKVQKENRVEEYEDYRWYRAIRKKLEDLKIDLKELEPYSEVADRLLGGISYNALKTFNKAFNQEDKDEEN